MQHPQSEVDPDQVDERITFELFIEMIVSIRRGPGITAEPLQIEQTRRRTASACTPASSPRRHIASAPRRRMPAVVKVGSTVMILPFIENRVRRRVCCPAVRGKFLRDAATLTAASKTMADFFMFLPPSYFLWWRKRCSTRRSRSQGRRGPAVVGNFGRFFEIPFSARPFRVGIYYLLR